MKEKTEWIGQKTCDYCGKTDETMYDAATKEGPWAFMCPKCWKEHGFALLGPGFGQRYEKAADGRYIKAEG